MNRILRNCNNCYIDADQKNDDDVVVVVCLSVSNDFGFTDLMYNQKLDQKMSFKTRALTMKEKLF